MAINFLNDSSQSHMPFFTTGENGAPTYFFCLKKDGYWKIHYSLDGKNVNRLETGRETDATECSPYAEYRNHQWHITFIAGGAGGNRRFRMYRMIGVDSTPEIIDNAGYGFESKNRIIIGNHDNSFEIRRPGKTDLWTFSGVEYIYRLTANYLNPNELFISGRLISGETFTWIVNILFGNLRNLSLDNTDAYKACFFNERWFYAQRFGNAFEDRRIVEAETVQIFPMDIDSIVRVNGERFKPYTARENTFSLLNKLPEDLR